MDIAQSITQLMEKLDAWYDDNRATFETEDREAQGKALFRGFALMKELDQLKADGLASIRAAINGRDIGTDEGRAKSLMATFEFSARLADVLVDELSDYKAQKKIWHLIDKITLALDKIGRGRAALDELLEHPDAPVRNAAGAYLIDLMPERVIPVLDQIENKQERGVSLRAHWTLLGWKLERKSRFNYLTGSAPATAGPHVK